MVLLKPHSVAFTKSLWFTCNFIKHVAISNKPQMQIWYYCCKIM